MSNFFARQHLRGSSVKLFQSVVFKRDFHRSKCRWVESPADGLPLTATNSCVSNSLIVAKEYNTILNPSGAQTTAKRFWKTVGIEHHQDSILVTLDKRPLKTPAGATLIIPKSKPLLATLIAHEWDNQEILIKPFALPMTSLAARAIDSFSSEETRAEVRESLLKYLDTDTICFFEDYPPALVDLQDRHWSPLLDWARKEFKADIQIFKSLMSNSQSSETKAIFRSVLDGLDVWQLASTERAIYASKSLIVALALVRGRVTVEEAALASQVEVASQIQKWGEVEDSHDVEFHEIRRQLGSAACFLVSS